MGKWSATRAYEPLEVDLWSAEDGAVFQTAELTRSSFKAAQKLLEAIDAAKDADEGVAASCEYLDFRLRPLGGGQRKPSTLIRKRWENDQLSPSRVADLVAEVIEADRPT